MVSSFYFLESIDDIKLVVYENNVIVFFVEILSKFSSITLIEIEIFTCYLI